MEDLAPGVRFYPTEEELVSFYLHHKLEGNRHHLNQIMDRVIPVLDIYEFSPWQLPELSGEFNKGDQEQWFFFIPAQESEVRGGRPNRLTTCGYWKATGSPGCVYSSNNRLIGVKRTMVFYHGRAPRGSKTEWKMNEYKALQEDSSSSSLTTPKLRQEYSVCRVYKKSKCIRSFDRRPVGVQIGQLRAQMVDGDDNEAERGTHHEQVSTVKIGNSPDDQSSSSGDNGHGYGPYQSGEGSNLPMAIDGEHLLYLDQLMDNCSSFWGGFAAQI